MLEAAFIGFVGITGGPEVGFFFCTVNSKPIDFCFIAEQHEMQNSAICRHN
jgi:hypothetical protein